MSWTQAGHKNSQNPSHNLSHKVVTNWEAFFKRRPKSEAKLIIWPGNSKARKGTFIDGAAQVAAQDAAQVTAQVAAEVAAEVAAVDVFFTD